MIGPSWVGGGSIVWGGSTGVESAGMKQSRRHGDQPTLTLMSAADAATHAAARQTDLLRNFIERYSIQTAAFRQETFLKTTTALNASGKKTCYLLRRRTATPTLPLSAVRETSSGNFDPLFITAMMKSEGLRYKFFCKFLVHLVVESYQRTIKRMYGSEIRPADAALWPRQGYNNE